MDPTHARTHFERAKKHTLPTGKGLVPLSLLLGWKAGPTFLSPLPKTSVEHVGRLTIQYCMYKLRWETGLDVTLRGGAHGPVDGEL